MVNAYRKWSRCRGLLSEAGIGGFMAETATRALDVAGLVTDSFCAWRLAPPVRGP